MDIEKFEGRKRDHIRHSLDPDAQASGLTGLDRVRLIHDALPELDFDDVSLASTCLGKRLATPFYLASMTAGHADAPALNHRLGLACARRGWAMGVGSQRRELENGNGKQVDHWLRLRAEAPDLMLFANIGLSQVLDVGIDRIRSLVKGLGASALCIHLNSLQECMQPEGTPRFKGGLQRIREISAELGTPVILKETGCGMSRATLARIATSGVSAVDVSGLGGTHWGRIEGKRASEAGTGAAYAVRAGAAETFANWGVPTAESVRSASETLPPHMEIWASGGVRSGLDAAKLIALGAHRVGYAKPALEAGLEGEAALDLWMARQEFELKTALFCTGSATMDRLRKEKSWTTSAG